MRRHEKEIKDFKEIERLLAQAPVGRIAMADGDQPYVAPVNFAYENGALYFHSAKEGKKIDILKKNPRVCFELDAPGELVKNATACQWGMRYQSVIGFGQACFIESQNEKRRALDLLMKKYSGRGSFDYSDEALDSVLVVEVKIERMSGKKSG